MSMVWSLPRRSWKCGSAAKIPRRSCADYVKRAPSHDCSCRAAGTMSSPPFLCRYALHGYGDSDGYEVVAGPAVGTEETAAPQAASYELEVSRGLDNSRR